MPVTSSWALRSVAAAVAAVAFGAAPAGAQTRLLRFPDISGDAVAFCYAGDIWRAPAAGGTAARITAHPGVEVFPRFSPDGKWIAFTGQYDGDDQVYVVASDGGVPRQLTYYPARGPLAPRHGVDNQVIGWSPDGARVLFRSMRDAGGAIESALYTVDLAGGLPVKLPMPTSGAGDFSPNGKLIVYSPLFRDFRTWKRYQGGWAQDLFIYDLATNAVRAIAPSVRTERDPMWIGGTIYFASDRDGTLNLYAYDFAADKLEQLTRSAEWDVRWPASDNRGRIVYELGGELVVYDVAARKEAKISITVPDDGLNTRPSRYSAAKNVEDFELSPKGERALFVARGDVFTAPIEHGPTRNLTNSSDAHDKWARWSPDGAKIAFVSDMSGEDQLYLVDQAGEGKPEQLTAQFAVMLNAPAWAPDGKRLAFSDKDGKLFVLTVADRKVVQVADDEYGGINDYSWSPDGAWLSFSLNDPNRTSSLFIWSAADGTLSRVTDGTFNEVAPVWDPEGGYLYYLSDREFAPQISTFEWNFATNRTTGIFALALRKDVANPFAPRSDEVTVEKAGDGGPGTGDRKEKSGEKAKKDDKGKDEKGKDGEKKKEPKPVKIDFDGLAERVSRVPIDADNIDSLGANKGHLIYTTSGAGFYGRDSYADSSLKVYDLEEREASELTTDVDGWALSADGAKLLVRQGRSYSLYDAKPKAKEKKPVSTAELYVDRVPAQEWLEVFNEVWRRYRDFFYVRNMHGYDWNALGNRYRELVKYVAHRSDLNYVLGEMVSELSVGHAYIEGGDYEVPARPRVALPGARLELDAAAGRYRIAKIFAGDNEEPKYRSPLTEVGVDARVGDYVLAVDGVDLPANENPYRLLRNRTNAVTLTLNDRPVLEGARKVEYVPIDAEDDLIYKEWVDGNRAKVAAMTDGKVGYMHIPDMGAPGAYEFIKWFYPQLDKHGMIVDVRSNGGGNISQWIIERLDSKLLGTRFGYISEHPTTYPGTVLHAHKVCLISETSASDGDIFPYYFRKAGLGPLIGKRTWGGVVGISGRGPLLDGGRVFVPLNATNDENGAYIIEGHGVDPDIEVENDPASVIAGRDSQLERGVQEVLKAMAAQPLALPGRPADPVKTR